MSAILIILGNTNTASFYNCLTAATEALRANPDRQASSFKKVHIVHTAESLVKIVDTQQQAAAIESTGLRQSDFVHHVVDLASDSERRLDELLSEIAEIANSKDPNTLHFDLTGGVTQVKVALAILAFLLGARHVYTLEVAPKPDQRAWSLKQLRDEGVPVSYKQISNLDQFDRFGLSNLTAVRRVRPELKSLKLKLDTSFPEATSELDHLVSNLEQAEALRLQQEDRFRHANIADSVELAATHSILFHATAAAEAVVDLVIERTSSIGNTTGQTLGNKLRRLRNLAGTQSSHPIDPATLNHLSELLLRLRNRAAHWSNQGSSASAMEIQGELGLRLSRSFIWLITTSLQSFVNKDDELVSIQLVDRKSMSKGTWYVGVDGDRTGEYIAASLTDSTDAAHDIRFRSNKISEALEEMKKSIKTKCRNASILFASGDNLLFHGEASFELVESLLDLYTRITGLSASAGAGRTPYQASVALSLAKGEGGGIVKVITVAD